MLTSPGTCDSIVLHGCDWMVSAEWMHLVLVHMMEALAMIGAACNYLRRYQTQWKLW